MKLNLPYATQLAILFALGQAMRVVASPIPLTPSGTDVAITGVAPVETHEHSTSVERPFGSVASISDEIVHPARRAPENDLGGKAAGDDCDDDDEQVPVKVGSGGAAGGAGGGGSGAGLDDDCEDGPVTAGSGANGAVKAEDECEEEDIAPLGSVHTAKPPPAQQDLPGNTPAITQPEADKAREADEC